MEKINGGFKNDVLTVYKLPDRNLVVPLLGPITHECPLQFLHIRDFKCPLKKCKEARAKVHTLLKKEGPLCLHNLLAWCTVSQDGNEVTSSENESAQPKLDRDLTVQHIMMKIITSFPSMSSENSEFLG